MSRDFSPIAHIFTKLFVFLSHFQAYYIIILFIREPGSKKKYDTLLSLVKKRPHLITFLVLSSIE